MNTTETETVDIVPITFAPGVLARVSPELSLQRHLSISIRPSLREYEEFREIQINSSVLSRYVEENITKTSQNNILGSNILKCGKTIVITSITGGIIEENIETQQVEFTGNLLDQYSGRRQEIGSYSSVFPVVEVERGRGSAPPSDEEMNISQKLHDCILHSGLIPRESLKVKCGIRSIDELGNTKIYYADGGDDDKKLETLESKRLWYYVLYVKVAVFGRTGPLFDTCWNSIIYALQNTKLPRAYIDERATTLRMNIRSRGRSASVRETYNILCDPIEKTELKLDSNNISYASNYGVVSIDPNLVSLKPNLDDEEDIDMNTHDSILLADLDTEAEETSVLSTISIISNKEGDLKNVSIYGGGSRITFNNIKKAMLLSKQRSLDLGTIL